MRTIQSLRLDGLLSFAPGSPAFDLGALNVLIGANGSGKSNVVEALELLRSTPVDFAQAIRDGGGPQEWLWKGDPPSRHATLDAVLEAKSPARQPLRYRLLPDAKNLALVLNRIQHRDGRRFDDLLKRFFPRFERMTTLVSGGTVQFYLHETGFSSPIPPTRLSEGRLLGVPVGPAPPARGFRRPRGHRQAGLRSHPHDPRHGRPNPTMWRGPWSGRSAAAGTWCTSGPSGA